VVPLALGPGSGRLSALRSCLRRRVSRGFDRCVLGVLPGVRRAAKAEDRRGRETRARPYATSTQLTLASTLPGPQGNDGGTKLAGVFRERIRRAERGSWSWLSWARTK
jgi:hypothetical protein